MRVVLGILKGGLIGGALGYAAAVLGLAGALALAVYAAIGFVTGVVCGRPLWRHETLWTPAVKGILGALVCAGLAWGAGRILGGLTVPFAAALGLAEGTALVAVPYLLGPVVAIPFGVLVEVDDGGPERRAATPGGGKGGGGAAA